MQGRAEHMSRGQLVSQFVKPTLLPPLGIKLTENHSSHKGCVGQSVEWDVHHVTVVTIINSSRCNLKQALHLYLAHTTAAYKLKHCSQLSKSGTSLRQVLPVCLAISCRHSSPLRHHIVLQEFRHLDVVPTLYLLN